MPPPNDESKLQRRRREEAELRLQTGLAPALQSMPPSLDTLTLLHDLASSPATASSALKLLHELQVHQVELDLITLQTEEEQRETASQLARYKSIYDHAPIAYFVVGLNNGEILEGNLAGARLLEISHEQLEDLCLRHFFSAASQVALHVLIDLARVEADEAVSCLLELEDSGGGLRRLHATATWAPGGEAALVMLVPCETG